MYGADKQMENQARLALRLANFISAFLQVGVAVWRSVPRLRSAAGCRLSR